MLTLDSEVLGIRGDLSSCPICGDKPVAVVWKKQLQSKQLQSQFHARCIQAYRICCGNNKCRFFFSTFTHNDQLLAAKEWQETIAKIRSRILAVRVEKTRGLAL